MMLKTKADTLKMLKDKLVHSYVLPLVSVNYSHWKTEKAAFVKQIMREFDQPLVVRSSAVNEDVSGQSNAGKYVSLIGVAPEEKELERAITEVFNSYDGINEKDQVFIQPQLTTFQIAGVVFSHDPNTASPYYCINYDDSSTRTDSVTAGDSAATKIEVVSHIKESATGWQKSVILAIKELQELSSVEFLDVEFAIDRHDNVCLFQVRELHVQKHSGVSTDKMQLELNCVYNKIYRLSQPHPYLLGKKSIFGVMPDWNPAEIIGIKPKPLALSLYKELITDDVWSHQRASYGYRDVKDFPLLVVLGGTPYVDTRLSFNSFIPAKLPDSLAEKLINYYTQRLENSPQLHDKVEFDIVLSCFDFAIDEKLAELTRHDFSMSDITLIKNTLLELTKSLVESENSIWQQDLKKVDVLKCKRQLVKSSSLNSVEQIYWLLKDCRNFGTLPFAGLARVGFIAVQMLTSLVTKGAISLERKNDFLSSLATVSTQIGLDKQQGDRDSFMAKYGHLRPGTYDILSKRYDEAPELYFDWQDVTQIELSREFSLTDQETQNINHLLANTGFSIDAPSLFSFFKRAIEAREYGKFVFSQSLSEALVWLEKLGEKLGFSREEVSFVDIKDILALYSNSLSAKEVFKSSIQLGKEHFELCQQVQLPQLITSPEQTYHFALLEQQPNFVTLNKVTAAPVIYRADSGADLAGKVVFIESADPGYDWLFSKNIAGLVTKYGGCNSHMAIRASELNLAAIIGAGDKYYDLWSRARKITIDCANHKVECL